MVAMATSPFRHRHPRATPDCGGSRRHRWWARARVPLEGQVRRGWMVAAPAPVVGWFFVCVFHARPVLGVPVPLLGHVLGHSMNALPDALAVAGTVSLQPLLRGRLQVRLVPGAEGQAQSGEKIMCEGSRRRSRRNSPPPGGRSKLSSTSDPTGPPGLTSACQPLRSPLLSPLDTQTHTAPAWPCCPTDLVSPPSRTLGHFPTLYLCTHSSCGLPQGLLASVRPSLMSQGHSYSARAQCSITPRTGHPGCCRTESSPEPPPPHLHDNPWPFKKPAESAPPGQGPHIGHLRALGGPAPPAEQKMEEHLQGLEKQVWASSPQEEAKAEAGPCRGHCQSQRDPGVRGSTEQESRVVTHLREQAQGRLGWAQSHRAQTLLGQHPELVLNSSHWPGHTPSCPVMGLPPLALGHPLLCWMPCADRSCPRAKWAGSPVGGKGARA